MDQPRMALGGDLLYPLRLFWQHGTHLAKALSRATDHRIFVPNPGREDEKSNPYMDMAGPWALQYQLRLCHEATDLYLSLLFPVPFLSPPIRHES